ncbi:MAG: galactosyltransferase-related protein [Cytophagales bacterium]|nr:galactosyltransferase-related protein [Cytophagales bacterium]
MEIEIVLIEQDKTQKIDPTTLPPTCKHIFAYNNGLFNRAWGLNVGFRHSSGKAIAFADNDILADREILRDSLTLCHDEYDYDAIKPFDRVTDLDEGETKKILAGNQFLDFSVFNEAKFRIGLSFCGGLVVFRRRAYEQLGGFDERFIGWGGEDDAMSKFKIPLLRKAYVVKENAYHLWHERSVNDGRLQPNYKNNLRLLREYYSYSNEELLDLCAKSRSNFGRLDKRRTRGSQI